MFKQQPAMRILPQSPFQDPRSGETSSARYARIVNELARKFIYNTGELKQLEIERAIEEKKRQPGMLELESERGELESLKLFLQGMAEQEIANARMDQWWPEIKRQDKSEACTREQVQGLYERFEYRRPLEYAENRAIHFYEAWLEFHPELGVKLTENISLDRADVEVLLIDLRINIAERILDTEQRRAELEKLDQKLADIIEQLPREQFGKKYELEEIYLLRRLIHTADTGHLASVRHGMPREDLRPDFGSVDMVLTSAGRRIDFQMKTHNPDARLEARETQYQSVKKAEQNAKANGTNVVKLNAKAIENTHQNSLRQVDKRTSQSVRDKYAALQPLVVVIQRLDEKDQARFLEPIGFKEVDLKREEEAFEKGQAEMTAHGEAWRKKREEDRLELERIDAEYLAAEKAKIEAQQEAERDRERRILDDQRRQVEESAAKRAAIVAVAEQKRRASEAEQAAKQEKLENQKRSAEEAKKRNERKTTKDEEKKWVEMKLTELGKPDSLVSLGYLAAEDRNKVTAILAAKKLLAAKYPNAKSVLKEFPFQQ